jgi:hypothetical protein
MLLTFKSMVLSNTSSSESSTVPCGTQPATLKSTSTLSNLEKYSATAAESVTSRTADSIPSGRVLRRSLLISLE